MRGDEGVGEKARDGESSVAGVCGAPTGMCSPVSFGTMKPFRCGSHLYPLNGHPQRPQGSSHRLVRVRWKPKGDRRLILSAELVSGNTEVL